MSQGEKITKIGEEGSTAVLLVIFMILFAFLSVSGAFTNHLGFQMDALNNLRYHDDRTDISNRVQFLLNRRVNCQSALQNISLPSQQTPTILNSLIYPGDAYILPTDSATRTLLSPNLKYGFQTVRSIQLEFVQRIPLNAQATLFSSSILANLRVRFNDVAFRSTRDFSIALYLTPVIASNSIGSCFATVLNSDGKTLEDSACFNSRNGRQTAAVFNPDNLRCVRW